MPPEQERGTLETQTGTCVLLLDGDGLERARDSLLDQRQRLETHFIIHLDLDCSNRSCRNSTVHCGISSADPLELFLAS